MRMRKMFSAVLAGICLVATLNFFPQNVVLADSDEAAYWRSFESRYYYDHALSDQQKEIYDQMHDRLEEVLLSDETLEYVEFDLSRYRFDNKEETWFYANDVLLYVIHCSPQFYYWEYSYPVYSNIDGQEYLTSIRLTLLPDLQDGAARREYTAKLKKSLDSYISEVPADALPEEKERIIHDLMIDRIVYEDYLLPSGASTTQGIFSAAMGHTICMGYADLFEALMNRLGVECVVVCGTGHAWNLINLHGYCYLVDVTADDCFEPYAYARYNDRGDIYKIEGLWVSVSSDIELLYDNLDDDPEGNYKYTNYSSRYVHKGADTYFILNDFDDDKGRLALYIDGDDTDFEWIAYNGMTYKVKNSSTAGKKADFSDFVERLYVVALCRDSEKAGKDFWCEHVGNGELTGADCARCFLTSEEFKGRELDNSAFVKTLYRVFFNREALEDPEGFKFWLDSLESTSRENVIEGFINSPEWVDVCSRYGVKSGSNYKKTVASDNAIAFATRLYTECLGRDPEEGGLKYWSLGLTNQELTGTKAAREFFYSEEFKSLGVDNNEYVNRLYKTFMGRDPEEDGFNYWMNALSNGMTRDEVFDFFSTCQEFTDICKEYSIIR